MARSFILLILALISSSAEAGMRATYGAAMRSPMVVEVADNGDVRASLGPNRRLIILADGAYLVEDRLTGPLVTQVPTDTSPAATPARNFVERGTAEVSGRSGRAFFFANAVGQAAERPVAVVSTDPALDILAAAMRRVFGAQALLDVSEHSWPAEARAMQNALLALLEQGAPLAYGDWKLRELDQASVDPVAFALPAAPETPEAMRLRHDREAQDRQGAQNQDEMISRALFADGRLWLRTDSGRLSSLAEGERTQTIHDLGGNVLDMCERDGALVALTAQRGGTGHWTIHRREGGTWRVTGSVPASADRLVALSCGPGLEMAVTNRRLVGLTGAAPAIALSEPFQRSSPGTSVYASRDAIFVGLNLGEWGGGLRRIDRRTGRVSTIERNATGGLCDGPLNTDCDPVNGIVAIPWRPGCFAAAIGLIHFAAHGRIAAICPGGIEQMFAAPDAIDPGNPADVAQAEKGGLGSVAFFGLTATRNALIAVGHNGLYRIEANGTATRAPWPRFTEVDGILVSFALPDVVLVITGVNRRASLSGFTPLMAVR